MALHNHYSAALIGLVITIVILIIWFGSEGENEQKKDDLMTKPIIDKQEDKMSFGKRLSNLQLQKHIVTAIVGAATGIIGTGIVFFFSTKYTLANHTEKLESLDKRMTVNEVKVESMQSDLSSIKTDLKDIKESQNQAHSDQEQNRQDLQKIYQLLLLKKQ